MNENCFRFNDSFTFLPNKNGNSSFIIDRSLSQILSAEFLRNAFSVGDLKIFLDQNSKSENFLRTKTFRTIFTFSIVSLFLSIFVCSLFCVANFLRIRPKQNLSLPNSFATKLSFTFLSVLYVIGLIQTIFVTIRINSAVTALDETFSQLNGPIYPTEIRNFLLDLNRQGRCVDSSISNGNSIVANGSRTIIFETLEIILRDYLLIDEVSTTINRTLFDLKTVENFFLNDSSISATAKNSLKDFFSNFESDLVSMKTNWEFFFRNRTNLNAKLDELIESSMESFREKLNIFFGFLDGFSFDEKLFRFEFGKILFWSKTFLLIFLWTFCLAPIVPFFRRKSKKIRFDIFCPLIFIFSFLFNLSILFFFLAELFLENFCEFSHENPRDVAKIFIDKFLPGNSTQDFLATIEDCRENRHFLRRFESQTKSAIDLSLDLLDKDFLRTMHKIQFDSNFQLTNQTQILQQFPRLNEDFQMIEILSRNLSSIKTLLPTTLRQKTVEKFTNFFFTVLTSTVDRCPIPLVTIYKVHELVCHKLGKSSFGLWLNLLVLMIFVGLVHYTLTSVFMKIYFSSI